MEPDGAACAHVQARGGVAAPHVARSLRSPEEELTVGGRIPGMNRRTFLVGALPSAVSLTAASQAKCYLYMSTPDASQENYKSGQGILVFDIDDGHKFVRRIDVPDFKEGLRGFTPNLKTRRAFFSTSNKRVGAIDLETEKVLWSKTYEAGADRSSVTLDGKKVYVPTGWWDLKPDGGLLVLNAESGDKIKRITIGPAAHNSLVSLNGRFLYLGTQTTLTVFD